MAAYDYIHDGMAIYERSFAIIRAEADLSRFSEAEADVAIRMIHACGQVEAASHFVFASSFVDAARTALAAGAPIFCDNAPSANLGLPSSRNIDRMSWYARGWKTPSVGAT